MKQFIHTEMRVPCQNRETIEERASVDQTGRY